MVLPEEVYALKINSDSTINLNPCNNINSCIVLELTLLSSHFKIQVGLRSQNHSASVAAIVDCRATTFFISERFIKMNSIHTHPFIRNISLYNIDGSKNKAGNIFHFNHLRL
jgi:hypothetical protein